MANNPVLSALFGRSPIAPLQKHISLASQCAALLPEYLAAVMADDWETADRAVEKILALEDQADSAKKKIRLNLPKSLFLPFSRSDLLELLQVQDRIANVTKDIAGLIRGRKMHIPEAIREDLAAYLNHCVQATRLARNALEELDELVSTGFGGKEVRVVESIVENVDKVEHETDLMQVKVRAKLFEIEETLPPIDVMFLYKIIEWIGDMADHAQMVGNRMLYLIAR